MKYDSISIYSNYALISDWLISNCNDFGWECFMGDKSAIRENIALIDVATKDDVSFVSKCEERGIPVVVFTRLPPSQLLCVVYEREIKGLLHLSSTKNSIQTTLESASTNEEYFDEKVLTYMLSIKFQEIYESISSLSNRELEIVDGIMDDLNNDEIAEKFQLSVRTVNAHKRNILQKMKTRSLIGLARLMMNYTIRYT